MHSFAQTVLGGKDEVAPPQFRFKFLSGTALRVRIIQLDPMFRNADDASDTGTAEVCGHLLDLAWGEARHREAEKVRRRHSEAFVCGRCGNAGRGGR